MSNLLIVESPAKAKTIKKYLGNNYKVVASMGHIRDLPKSKLGIDVKNDFKPQYIAIRGKASLISDLKKEAKASKKIFLATDPDREGEAISWHLANVLGIDLNDKVRVTFNEITKSAVTEGVTHPRRINMDLVNAQQARRLLDRLVGYGISPILWKKIRKGLSAGRVQSVATKLVVDRENEIEAFKPEEYWIIDADLKKSDKSFVARYHGCNGRKEGIKKGDRANEIVSAVQNGKWTVSKVVKEQKSKSPAPPFTTSTLQQDASRILNMSSKRTMQIAQQLYEGVDIPGHGLTGLITYMRTDSLRLSDDALNDARAYINNKFGSKYLPKTARRFKTKNGAQDAHEAIRPTSTEFDPETVKNDLNHDQFRLYKLIWDRFIACQMASEIFDTVSVDITVDKKYLFKANGRSILFKGFAAVYDKPDKNDEEHITNLPALAEGDEVKLEKLLPQQKFTQPPSRYTEASLIKTLEENGIGRPSTYAPTISTILQREYVVREGKLFKPTQLGIVTTEFMCDKFSDIVDTEFTANMEEALDRIEDGTIDWVEVVRKFDDGLEEHKKKIEDDPDTGRIKLPDEETDEVCELCGAKMVIKSGRFGKFLACPNYPQCKNTKSITYPTGTKCPKCGKEILLKFSKNGNKYYGCSGAPDCDFMTWYEPTDQKCPKCGSVMLKKTGFKGRFTLICSNDNCSEKED